MPEVSVDLGTTINLGDFNLYKINIGIKDETRKDEKVNEAFDRIYKFVEKKLEEKVQEALEDNAK